MAENLMQQAVKVRQEQIRVAQAKPQEAPNEATRKAIEHVANNPELSGEAMATMENAAKPQDHSEKIDEIAEKFETGVDRKGKPKDHETKEAAEKQKFLTETRLYNDLLQNGYDNIGNSQDYKPNPDGTTKNGQSQTERQQALRDKVITSLRTDRNFKAYVDVCVDANSVEDPAKIQELAERYLRRGTPDGDITLAKLETHLTTLLDNEQFSSIDPGAKRQEIYNAQIAVAETQEPLAENQEALDRVNEHLKDYEAGGDSGKRIGELKDKLDKLDDAGKTDLANTKSQLAAIEQQRDDLAARIQATIQANPMAYGRPELSAAIQQLNNFENDIKVLRQKEPYRFERELQTLKDKEKSLKREKKQLEAERQALQLKLENTKQDQKEAEKSQAHMRSERIHQQKSLNRELSYSLGGAVIEHETTEAKFTSQLITERIPMEEQQIAAQRNEADRNACSGVNKYLDTIWSRKRRLTRFGKLIGIGKDRSEEGFKKKLGKFAGGLVEKALYEEPLETVAAPIEAPLRQDVVEKSYRNIIDTNNGVDDLLSNFEVGGTVSVQKKNPDGTLIVDATGQPVMETRNKTFADLSDANDDEKKLKNMLRGQALRHTINVRYDLSVEMGKKTGEPPRQVTAQDLDQITQRSWADAAISEGIKTEQAKQALTEKDPNDPLDEPVTPEELADAQKDAKTPDEQAKKQTAIRKIMAKVRKGGKAAAMVLGISLAALLLLGMTAGGQSSR